MSNPKLRMYERLWKSFSKHERPLKWTRDLLMRVAGVSDERWAGQLDAAIAYLEFSGHVETSPAGVVYRLPIINGTKAMAAAAAIGARRVDGSIVYEVHPGAKDRAEQLYAPGVCTYRPPEPATVVKVLLNKLLVTQDDLDQKRWRAEDGIESIYRFAKAANKKRFIDRAFVS
jgi:hypothetical protein